MHVTETVAIPLTGGQTMPAALAVGRRRDAGDGPGAAVLVLHELLGLNDDIRRIAVDLADEGYTALAPDFLAGLGPRPFCMARFVRGLGSVGTGRPYRRLEAARRWLAARPDVDGRRIAVAGFCVGGGFALLYAATHGPGAVAAVAPFYGAVPDDPARSLEGICPVIAAYGGRDRVFGPAAGRLKAGLEAIRVDHEVTVYPEAGHSFMNRHGALTTAIERRLPTHGGYHRSSAEAAWGRMLAFLERHLGEPGGPPVGPVS